MLLIEATNPETTTVTAICGGTPVRPLMEKDGRRWVGMPAKRFTKADGTAMYIPLIDFTDRATEDKFRDLVLAAFDAAHASQQSVP